MRNWDLSWGIIFLVLGIKMLRNWPGIVEWIGRKAFFHHRFRTGQVFVVITAGLIITAVGVLGLCQFALDRDLRPFGHSARPGTSG